MRLRDMTLEQLERKLARMEKAGNDKTSRANHVRYQIRKLTGTDKKE